MKKVLSNNKVSNYIKGLEYLKRGDIAAAKESFEKAIQHNAHFSFAHHYLGEAHFVSEQFDNAEASFQQAFELNPYFAPTLLYLGKIAEAKGDDLKRDELFRAALEKRGPSSSELKQLARTLIKIDEADHAAVLELYLEAHRSNPEDLDIYLDIAGINPPNADVFAEFGAHLSTVGKFEQSIFFLYLAAHMQPEKREHWTRLSDVLDESGDTESAEICRNR
jgi:tetratricopeptide (TPR) repeat protein